MQEVIAITLFFQKVSRKVGDEIIHPYYKLNSYSNLVGSQGNECHLHLEDPQMPKCISLLGKILGNYIICNTVPSFRAFFCFWWNLNALIYVRGPFPWASKSQLFPSAWSSHSTYSCTYFEKSLPIHSKKCMCAGYLEMDFARISQFLRVQAGLVPRSLWPQAGPGWAIWQHRAAMFGLDLWLQRKYQPSILLMTILKIQLSVPTKRQNQINRMSKWAGLKTINSFGMLRK